MPDKCGYKTFVCFNSDIFLHNYGRYFCYEDLNQLILFLWNVCRWRYLGYILIIGDVLGQSCQKCKNKISSRSRVLSISKTTGYLSLIKVCLTLVHFFGQNWFFSKLMSIKFLAFNSPMVEATFLIFLQFLPNCR